MARPIDRVSSADIDEIRFDDLSFDTPDGRVGVTLYLPSMREVARQGEPDILCPYSAGWGEGMGAARAACEGLVRSAHVMAATITYPPTKVTVGEILPTRTRVLSAVIRHVASTIYDTSRIVVVGYSRGTGPARVAALQQRDRISGVALVAPTWFAGEVNPRTLAQRGIAEGARGMREAGWMDRFTLLGASARLAQEMITHPLALRKDIEAISQEGATDLDDVLRTGLPVGVVAGTSDALCQTDGIRSVIERVHDDTGLTYVEVESDHFSYFITPRPARVIAQVVRSLGSG